jgi:hypothetical protein
MKRSDSKGINIFNVDFLGRNKNKEKKAAQKAALAAASLANTSDSQKKANKANKKANPNKRYEIESKLCSCFGPAVLTQKKSLI